LPKQNVAFCEPYATTAHVWLAPAAMSMRTGVGGATSAT
jgi:hypothetical protein